MTKGKIDRIENVHPMTQITIASIIQVTMFGLMFLVFWLNSKLFADEMVHQFKNPSFSGVRYICTLSYYRKSRV